MNAMTAVRLARLLTAVALAVSPLPSYSADPAPKPAADATKTTTESTPQKTDAKPTEPKKDEPKKDEPKKEAPKKEEPKLPVPSPSSPEWKLEVLKEKPAIHVPSVVCAAPD